MGVGLKNIDGWLVPESDKISHGIILNEVRNLEPITSFCKEKRTAIQAGGNTGVWPKWLSQRFQRVITVEPDEDNFAALRENLRDLLNIKAHRSAFGAFRGKGSIRVAEAGNNGAHQVIPGQDFDVISIDSLGVHDCDLLQLDIEGSEYPALLGAMRTILECRPVICVELKGLGSRYGVEDDDVKKLMALLGYKKVLEKGRDVIFAMETL